VEEDLEVTQSAFHKAFEDAMPVPAKVPGLQQFAASIWDRRKRIPSRQDPLLTLFDEVNKKRGIIIEPQLCSTMLSVPTHIPSPTWQFDRDNDGVLSSDEIAEALSSRGVNEITTAQVRRAKNKSRQM
jgi:hypothetical protein